MTIGCTATAFTPLSGAKPARKPGVICNWLKNKKVSMFQKIIIAIALIGSGQALSQPTSPQYLQLKDRLDRPGDGYCLDVVGSGKHIRLDMPLTAHNCKGPQVYADEVVQFRSDQSLYFPAYDGCVTAMGLNDKALPGNALMLKACGVAQPFLNARKFQRFEFNAQGQVMLVGSHLCLTAGGESHTTYSLEHKWRSLFLLTCAEAELTHSVWNLVPAGYNR